MKLFKSIDERLRELGFKKINENKYGAYYRRSVENESEKPYIHELDIIHKASKKHLIQSYELRINSEGFNNTVGLDYETVKLALRKYRELKRRYHW